MILHTYQLIVCGGRSTSTCILSPSDMLSRCFVLVMIFSYFPAVIDDLMGITIEIATYTRRGFLDDALLLVNEKKD